VRRRVVVGVDLGQLRTPAAVAVLELRDGAPVWDGVEWRWSPGLAGEVAVLRMVEVMELGTAYTTVSRRVWGVAMAAEADVVCFDQTGVGNAVVELLRQARPAELRCGLRGVVMTGGLTASANGDHVPRHELMQRLAVDFERGRLRVARGVAGWEALRRELLGLDAAGRRRRETDDRVVAVALANWGLRGGGVAGERGEGRLV